MSSTRTSSSALSMAGDYRIAPNKKPGQLITVGRAGPHGDCGLRDPVEKRLIAFGQVQLFYVGAFDVLWHRRLFDFRLFLAELDEKVFFLSL